jgi:moderate conductance mechanosensitive channel
MARLAALWLGLGLGLGLLAVAGSVMQAQGQDKPAAKAPVLPEPLTPEAIRELVARLSDAEVRQLLIAQLDRAAAPAASAGQPGDAMMPEAMAGRMDTLRSRAATVLASAPRLPGEVRTAVARFSEGRSAHHLLLVILFLGAMGLAGWVAEWLTGRLVAGVRHGLEAAPVEGFGAQAGTLLLRALLDLVGLVVFLAVALAMFLLVYQGHQASRELVLTALFGVLVARLVALLSRLVLAPETPALRLLAFDDLTARRLHGGVVTLALLWAANWVVMRSLVRWGLPGDLTVLGSTAVALAFAAIFLRLVWQNRAPIATGIRGHDERPHPLRRLLADLWPVLMTLYVAGILVAVIVDRLSGQPMHSAGILSLLVVIALPLCDMVLCRALAPRPGLPGAEGAGRGAGLEGSFGPVLRQGIHIAVTVGGLLLIARLWGMDVFALGERRLGTQLTGALVSGAMTLLLAYLAWQLAKTTIDQRIAGEAGAVAAEPGEEGTVQAATRLRTILPLIRAFLFVTICVIAGLIVLSSLGVNIGPLIAGAGVVGLAIGFGAQTLVRDVVSGLFFLLDDAFRLGEYIDVGDVKGTVERIGLRSMQLRHHRGPLNTVPYGNIRRLVNESRDWVIERLEFRVTYDTDIAKVRKILKKIGQEMMEDPDLAPGFLEPLKSQGITAADDSALVVRAKFMARPTDLRYVIRREAYSRVVKTFAENGIKFAHRQVTVFTPPGGGTPDGPAAAVRAAAAAAAAEPQDSPT